jgi:uncharacterized protein with HEPN domain
MSRRSVLLLLEDILEAISKIERYTLDLDEQQFRSDDLICDAVVRNLEIIGEAAARLPLEFRRSHHHVDWTKIVGLRNRIVHEYFGVDLAIIWHIIKRDLVHFRSELKILRDSAQK